MGLALKDIREYIEASDEDITRESLELFGVGQKQLDIPPRVFEIVKLLLAKPILVQPCLQWLNERLALLAQAELNVLYTPEQLAELRKQYNAE